MATLTDAQLEMLGTLAGLPEEEWYHLRDKRKQPALLRLEELGFVEHSPSSWSYWRLTERGREIAP